MPASTCIVAVDAGTTGIRSLVVDQHGAVVDLAYRELTQHFPRPGWVEHDPDEIRAGVVATLDEVAGRLDPSAEVAAIGITNQRETVVAWDRSSGRPLHRAIVWQDRRTADACLALEEAGLLPVVRDRTGLVLDPYFSATKMHWLLDQGGVEDGPDLALATVDTWVLWHLTGGPAGGVLATDATNASRTSLYDIRLRRWSEELCGAFGVPMRALADVRPSCGTFGTVAPGVLAPDSPLTGVPISGMAGDQHAALVGQACFEPGMAKVTYGTGSFVLVNAGPECPPPAPGLVTTIAWDLGDHGGDAPVAYAREGSVFVSGAAIQWLRDGLGLIGESAEMGALAASVDSSDGVVVVPAFAGLGSPHFDPAARGLISGLSRGTGRAHVARAVVEALAYQVRDVLDAVAASGSPVTRLRVDGGAAAMDLLLALQADQSRVEVSRPSSVESTAWGAAALAGLAEGVWGSTGELADLWHEEASFSPSGDRALADAGHAAWARAVERAGGWAHS